jgi:hypothetical protein
MGTRTVYRIVVRGRLSERYAIAFEGMEVEVGQDAHVVREQAREKPSEDGRRRNRYVR